MIQLGRKKSSEWIDIVAGARWHLRPLTSTLMMAARSDPRVRELDIELDEETGLPVNPDALSIPVSKVLAELAIIEWEGMGDAEGTPVEPTPEWIAAALDEWPILESFLANYAADGFLADQEKNVSASSPDGTSAGA